MNWGCPVIQIIFDKMMMTTNYLNTHINFDRFFFSSECNVDELMFVAVRIKIFSNSIETRKRHGQITIYYYIYVFQQIGKKEKKKCRKSISKINENKKKEKKKHKHEHSSENNKQIGRFSIIKIFYFLISKNKIHSFEI